MKALVVDLVFVGVEPVDRGIGDDPLGHVQERILRKEIVMIDQRDVAAGGQAQGRVGGFADMTVVVPADETHPGISSGRLLEESEDLRLRRGVVREAQLPAGVELPLDGLEELLQMARIGIVDRRQQADHGTREIVRRGFHPPA